MTIAATTPASAAPDSTPDAAAAAHAAATQAAAPAGHRHPLTLLGLLIGVTLAPMLAFNQTPSATLYNQLLAFFGFGLALIGLGVGGALQRGWRLDGVSIALLVMLAVALSAPVINDLPWSMALAGGAMLFGAWVLVQTARAVREDQRESILTLFCLALVTAGLLSVVVSFVQFFIPSWADGNVIARTGLAGRAVGNMRQPNHLASLLLWSCVAAVWLAQGGWLERRLRGGVRAAVALGGLLFLFVLCVLFSASRTGFIGVGLLALWGWTELLLAWGRPAAARLRKGPRIVLALTPVMFAASWGLVRWWTHASGHAFGAESRLSDEGAGSPSRLAILRNTWSLLKQHPWTGTGWGDFNFAWTMTPFPDRPVAFFDHCHNIVLQLLAEMGWPLGLLVIVLLVVGFVVAGLRGHADRRGAGLCAFMIVLMIGLHSMSEYPLWYAYFLLPAAFALGLCFVRPAKGDTVSADAVSAPAAAVASVASPRAKRWDLVTLGAITVLLVPVTVWDYLRIVHIYAPPQGAASLEERMAIGQRSPLFDLQADYALATVLPPGAEALVAAQRTGHHLIDTRLMVAWARSLAAVGETDKARFVAQRLKEFRNPVGDEFFAECKALETVKLDPRPFQCDPPSRVYQFQEMR
ncbi:O-antigen ligase [Roseateles sp. YR242]|uniref:PglL family O-oligosaccharyltransferase n=1 Tax=Roseateles sp. YR242 TaxID=1855305 RepID=UPI0008ADAA09|nr:Wzy polymerase domain-containing protein [Roseateles sp. YR242]SEL28280.1 O-antigen ligase [Roseateles sp. YR242]